MADKFPEIDDVVVDTNEAGVDSDFLSREKQALGNEFITVGDEAILKEANESEDDEEFEDFKSQFPEVDTPANVIAESQMEQQLSGEEKLNDSTTASVVNKFNNLNLADSEYIKEWKKTRDLEISKRDEIAERKLTDIKKEAEKAIDDFYDNYNNKKDDAIAETKKEEAAFLLKRDNFLENGTVWDRVVELLHLDKNSDSLDDVNYRDKSKFRDLLLALKGKEGVPGA
jgi:hypothetical protein